MSRTLYTIYNSKNVKDNFVYNITSKLAESHAVAIEEIIVKIFKENQIDISDIDNIIKSCKRIIHDNGDETLCYNDTPLILFKPIEFMQETQNGEIRVGIVQSWIKLYKNED